MLLRYFYDRTLAHASYMVGCQRAKKALIVDPGRDIDQYLGAAKREGMEIAAVAETHIHADYVSGARELADRVGAKLYVSDEGPDDWKYGYVAKYDHHLCKDGDRFQLGKIELQVMHTPGHTPESISFVLTDHGGGADKPMGIFTGDFVFVGSIGRPDLLEEAAGMKGTAEMGAHQLFHSAQKFRELPDHMQMWPAHGAGSACGKGLGAIPSSTVGYEKLFNPALQFDDEEEFVKYILADQPEAPKYFAVMKRVNKEGPTVLGDQPLPPHVEADLLDAALKDGTVVDLSEPSQYAEGHAAGTLNIPAGMLASWAGWLVDYDKPVYLIAGNDQLPEAVRVLNKIGVDHVKGVFAPKDLTAAGAMGQTYPNATPEQLADRIASGKVSLLDVRGQGEWNTGHIPQAEHRFLGKLPDNLAGIDRSKPVVAQCQSGRRSAIATSVLQNAGLEVINMAGGFGAWSEAGLPVDLPNGACDSVACASV
ncbi:MBL fold metallo-hydrolase [Aeoliella sp. ICT_H6.2]|uniref:MBL fold metallo-hydrolase n=1 Tax=Aeoliella straminimaris TaxID=2954799 RepID=A0A9X2F9N4_9BACT|nr:MBL fold metallo-hydrolase [Aeoliella straminimaris]MCO6042319.1 MBL fold metallo-hydrolase [Aeoliella straminimaris]